MTLKTTPRILVIIAVILLSLTGSMVTVQGQTKQVSARGKRTKRIKPTAIVKLPTATTTPSGLVYVITRRSNGRRPQAGETVVVHYTGLLATGAKFDSSLDRAQPLSFKLGVGRVIKGWDEGIAKLHVGEQATLIIPPQLAYGPAGRPPVIPPNSTLIFLVELIEIREVPVPN